MSLLVTLSCVNYSTDRHKIFTCSDHTRKQHINQLKQQCNTVAKYPSFQQLKIMGLNCTNIT